VWTTAYATLAPDRTKSFTSVCGLPLPSLGTGAEVLKHRGEQWSLQELFTWNKSAFFGTVRKILAFVAVTQSRLSVCCKLFGQFKRFLFCLFISPEAIKEDY